MDSKTWIRRTAVFAIMVALSAASAAATVTGGAVVGMSTTPKGVFIKLSVPLGYPYGPPNSVGENTFDRPNLYAFDEDQNIITSTQPETRNPILESELAADSADYAD